jgi:hypothetical protein
MPSHGQGTGINSKAAAIVQICRDATRCYIFMVHRWGKLFSSFARLLAASYVAKVSSRKVLASYTSSSQKVRARYYSLIDS